MHGLVLISFAYIGSLFEIGSGVGTTILKPKGIHIHADIRVSTSAFAPGICMSFF